MFFNYLRFNLVSDLVLISFQIWMSMQKDAELREEQVGTLFA